MKRRSLKQNTIVVFEKKRMIVIKIIILNSSDCYIYNQNKGASFDS